MRGRRASSTRPSANALEAMASPASASTVTRNLDLPYSRRMSNQPELTASHGHLLTLRSVGLGILRYGLAFILVLWGAFKFFEFESEAIRPFIENSPLLSWLYVV